MSAHPYEKWRELSETDPHAAHMAIGHAAAWHDSAGDSVTMVEFFGRAMDWHERRSVETIVKPPLANY